MSKAEGDAGFRAVTDAAELAQILDWAAEEGWNPGAEDAAAFFAADPGGFFIAELARAPVAAISVVNHSDSLAFLGLYLCRPAQRGKGIGFGLWQHALAHAGGRTVGLDGVAAQQANYARSGFQPQGATRRFQGELDGRADARIRPVGPADTDELIALDTAANGYARRAFLTAWLTERPSRQSVMLRKDGRASGFATVRRCREGVKIGPIIAETSEDALTLARAGLAAMPSPLAIVDLPAASVELEASLRGLGFEEGFATVRMFRGAPPEGSEMLQAIGTMELG